MQNTFKSNGYSLKKSRFYLPLYDKTNTYHKKISDLSKKATMETDSKKIAKLQKDISDLYVKMCESR